MNPKYLICALVIVMSTFAYSQEKSVREKDTISIRQAAFNYGEGYFEGSAERMQRALHPMLMKRGLIASTSGGSSFLVPMNSEMLIEAARLGGGKLAPDQRNISFEVLDISGTIASAKIFTAKFCDYLHLAKVKGEWRIVNVLWRPPSPQSTIDREKEGTAIKEALETMFKSAAAKDAEMAKSVLHPEVARRAFLPFKQGEPSLVQERNAETIIELIRSGKGIPPKDQAPPIVTVMGIYEDIASVMIVLPAYTDYVHLAKQNGQWRIVNGLTGLRSAPMQ